MSNTTVGAGAQALGDLSADLAERWSPADLAIWQKSPLAWLFNIRSGHRRGAAGEELMSKWLTDRGLIVRAPGNSDFDRWVDLPVAGRAPISFRVEIKTATGAGPGYRRLWWNQIRGWEGYAIDAVLFFGYTPYDAYVWIVPHDIAFANAKVGDGGVKGDGLNRQLIVDAAAPPAWLAPWGGPAGALNPGALLAAVATHNAARRR